MKSLLVLLCSIALSVSAHEKASPSDRRIVIAIMTQPKSTLNNATFTEDEYVLDINRQYIEASGAEAVPLYYDISDKALYQLLNNVNGVHFTGGGLTLVDPATGARHPYFVTSQKIFEYAISRNDVGDHFVLSGICQGFELFSLIVSEKKDFLSEIEWEDVQRNVTWTEPSNQIRQFRNFDTQVVEAMASQEITFHFHTFGVTLADYNANYNMNSFFKYNAIDTKNGTDYII